MIYGKDIEKVCALCVYSQKDGESNVICTRKKPKQHKITDTCRHYKYDIFKRQVHRHKEFTTDFKPEDFEL